MRARVRRPPPPRSPSSGHEFQRKLACTARHAGRRVVVHGNSSGRPPGHEPRRGGGTRGPKWASMVSAPGMPALPPKQHARAKGPRQHSRGRAGRLLDVLRASAAARVDPASKPAARAARSSPALTPREFQKNHAELDGFFGMTARWSFARPAEMHLQGNEVVEGQMSRAIDHTHRHRALRPPR